MTGPTTRDIRDRLVAELRKDLVGPGSEAEMLRDRPTVAYLMGILYPAYTEIAEEEDERLEMVLQEEDEEGLSDPFANEDVEDDEDQAEESELGKRSEIDDEEGVPLARTINPASIGLSFAVKDEVERLHIEVSYGLYRKGAKRADSWQRLPVRREVDIEMERESGKEELQNRAYVYWYARKSSGRWSVTVFLVNSNVLPDSETDEKRDRQEIDELCLFQPMLRISSPTVEYPFIHRSPENEVPLDADLETYELLYRNCYEFAIGHGCAVEWGQVQGLQAGVIWTVQVPSYELPATLPGDIQETRGLEMKELGKPSLQKEQVEVLIRPLILGYEQWIEARRKDVNALAEALRGTARLHLEKCEKALERMKAGLAMIQQDQQVFEAFHFANQAMLWQRSMSLWAREFRETGKRSKNPKWVGSWRPFQLAFILLNLPGIVDPRSEERDLVDLLWFPTGGGKTEAYLGLIAFTLGLRRLRRRQEEGNGDGGVTVIMRYTLRLLTTQQFQRAAALICACEYLRQRDSQERWGARPFQIGLWVGAAATPNTLAGAEKALGMLYNGEEVKTGNPCQLTSCPWCGTILTEKSYQIYRKPGTKDRVRMLVICPRKDCFFHTTEKELERGGNPNKSLPVVLVDEDIYHQCPSLVMATIDKFAGLPRQPKTMALFGMVDRYCPDHGYLSRTERHSGSHRGTVQTQVEECRSLLPPELIIQDELHLISGPLGTLAGLYEAAIDRLCSYERQSDKAVIRPKIIASTATIRRADDQVRSLFARNVQLFPPSGLSVEDSFFAVTQPLEKHAGRLYVGVCAPGRSIKTTLVRVYALLLQVTGEMLEQYGTEAADAYATLLGYFNSLRELGGALRLIEDDIVQRMRLLAEQRGRSEERKLQEEDRELTSRIPSYKIPEILGRLEQAVGEKGALDVLLATNMVSVGVDIPRLGLMVVNGQPKTSAEYIQATSRIGRQKERPGLVVTAFNWARPRDLSHYERFRPYHETMYRHVEATSVTPFAPRARDRALHAVLVSLARLLVEPWTPNNNASAFDPSNVLVEDIKRKLLTRVEYVDRELEQEVEEQLNILINWWRTMAGRHGQMLIYSQPWRNPNPRHRPLLHPANEKKPGGGSLPTLNSLRDVEGETQLFMIWPDQRR